VLRSDKTRNEIAVHRSSRTALLGQVMYRDAAPRFEYVLPGHRGAIAANAKALVFTSCHQDFVQLLDRYFTEVDVLYNELCAARRCEYVAAAFFLEPPFGGHRFRIWIIRRIRRADAHARRHRGDQRRARGNVAHKSSARLERVEFAESQAIGAPQACVTGQALRTARSQRDWSMRRHPPAPPSLPTATV
jgi:hypothetical protein